MARGCQQIRNSDMPNFLYKWWVLKDHISGTLTNSKFNLLYLSHIFTIYLYYVLCFIGVEMWGLLLPPIITNLCINYIKSLFRFFMTLCCQWWKIAAHSKHQWVSLVKLISLVFPTMLLICFKFYCLIATNLFDFSAKYFRKFCV